MNFFKSYIIVCEMLIICLLIVRCFSKLDRLKRLFFVLDVWYVRYFFFLVDFFIDIVYVNVDGLIF